MADKTLSPDLVAIIAERFKALSDPTRLRIMNALRTGERSVSDLVEATRLGQTNVSKHLHVLHGAGLVARRRKGAFVFYRIADARIFRLCDLMCDQLRSESDARGRVMERGPRWIVASLAV